jgi:hypothetical protein
VWREVFLCAFFLGVVAFIAWIWYDDRHNFSKLSLWLRGLKWIHLLDHALQPWKWRKQNLRNDFQPPNYTAQQSRKTWFLFILFPRGDCNLITFCLQVTIGHTFFTANQIDKIIIFIRCFKKAASTSTRSFSLSSGKYLYVIKSWGQARNIIAQLS